jgi:hypothetical protein
VTAPVFPFPDPANVPPTTPWRPILKIVYAYLNAEPLPADERRRLKLLADRIHENYRDGWNGFIPEAEMEDWDL